MHAGLGRRSSPQVLLKFQFRPIAVRAQTCGERFKQAGGGESLIGERFANEGGETFPLWRADSPLLIVVKFGKELPNDVRSPLFDGVHGSVLG
jgi:hypothetical protein